MEYVMIASAVLGGLQSITQGNAQAANYRLQAKVSEAKASREALNYELRANNTLKKLRSANSANLARGYSGGILGTEGSPLLVQTANSRNAGEEFMRDVDNAKFALTMGEAQSKQFLDAADTAQSSGYTSALGKFAMAGAGMYELYGNPFAAADPLSDPANWGGKVAI
jgi:hypothetical protein